MTAACTPAIPEGRVACVEHADCPLDWRCRYPERRCYASFGRDAGPRDASAVAPRDSGTDAGADAGAPHDAGADAGP
ncbi:MAG: hypothetical protein IT378_20420 [Sandaracinaceae bacterium]|nr:hypothetical protein [Sandaracinaceae bacterium]